MIAQNPDDRLRANITHSRAAMPFSAGTTADEMGKFRYARTNKNQTNKHHRFAAMKIFINFSMLGDCAGGDLPCAPVKADQIKPRPQARQVTQRPYT
jgi:hypothetical protein